MGGDEEQKRNLLSLEVKTNSRDTMSNKKISYNVIKFYDRQTNMRQLLK